MIVNSGGLEGTAHLATVITDPFDGLAVVACFALIVDLRALRLEVEADCIPFYRARKVSVAQRTRCIYR